MKVILSEDVSNLGKIGATVKVADGYARNYLLPRKLAVRADSATAKQIEHEMRIIRRREEKRLTEHKALAKSIEGVTVEIKVRAGEEDKIFGSVTTAHIAERLAEMGHTLDRRALHLDEPLKALGIFSVPVRLSGDVEANLTVLISDIQDETGV